MYAIIATGGKQLKVEPGQVVRVEKLAADVGEKVSFDQVLLVADGANVQMDAAGRRRCRGHCARTGQGAESDLFPLQGEEKCARQARTSAAVYQRQDR